MPREGIGPPTPAFSGPRSTTELPRLNNLLVNSPGTSPEYHLSINGLKRKTSMLYYLLYIFPLSRITQIASLAFGCPR